MTNVVDRDKLTIEHCTELNMSDDYMKNQLQGTKFLQFRKEILGK